MRSMVPVSRNSSIFAAIPFPMPATFVGPGLAIAFPLVTTRSNSRIVPAAAMYDLILNASPLARFSRRTSVSKHDASPEFSGRRAGGPPAASVADIGGAASRNAASAASPSHSPVSACFVIISLAPISERMFSVGSWNLSAVATQ